MLKNQSATISFFAYNSSTGEGVTGLTGWTCYLVRDGVNSTASGSVSEVSSSTMPGIYKITLTASEMNADVIVLSPSVSGAKVLPVTICPDEASGGGATAAEVWAYNGDRTITGTVTVNSEQATAFSQVADVSGLATSSALSAVKTSVDAIPTTTYTVPTAEEIKNAVWSATTKEITGDVNVSASSIASIQNGLSTFDPSEDAVTVNSTQATAFSQVADVSGLATAANLTTALTLLNKLFGLIGYFSVSSNTLTTYNAAGTALATYTLTRDASQNITGVTPDD